MISLTSILILFFIDVALNLLHLNFSLGLLESICNVGYAFYIVYADVLVLLLLYLVLLF